MLEIRAKVTESRAGVSLSQTHRGPEKSQEPLKILLDDYSNGFFKPGLVYYGKVKVTKLDGIPASGETIEVTAISINSSLHFSRNFTTGESGEIEFALCGGLAAVTSMKISAQSPRFKIPDSATEDVSTNFKISISMNPKWLWKHMGVHKSSKSNVRYVRQWFSPSFSYIHLSKNDWPFKCGQTYNIPVHYTGTAKSKVQFNHQVIARGQVMKVRQIEPEANGLPGVKIGSSWPDLCLEKENALTDRVTRDESITDADMSEDGQFSKTEDEEIQKRDLSGPLVEPLVRSPNVSDMVFKDEILLEIEPVMSPKFTLLLYHVMEDGEVMAGSMLYDVEPCFDNQLTTSDSEDVEVEKFYEEIEKAEGYLKSQDTIIVMGDFNAKVGDERVEDVVGSSGIRNVNERGSRLIAWCQVNDFTITNTWYQNHPRRQWTWKSPGDRSRNKIDYILIQKKIPKRCQNIEVTGGSQL
ncbi:craniofacial development protein 2-like protein [Plakobranchus ocellatus]|uniref:Craniofacial development protein 2-like protein n=1 Tax=Plakobranchus ocellatus TaxID=259542 RepID=A0AAV4AL16_9GAST|nr:craniofacial development protein 2-like protein [Plakobranchus ocellatus]